MLLDTSNFDGHDSRGKEKETGARGWVMMLTLCKLRHNFSQEDLATRFGVNQSTMSRLYSCWTKILEACINEFPLWLDKTSIQESVPATFKNLYPDTRVIIDSAEIETDRSHNLILSLWRGSTTSVELSRAASFIHSQVHCNQKACEGVHIFDNFDSSFRRSTSKKNKWIFSCITSQFLFLPVCLPPLYYFSFLFFFSNLHFWWQYHRQLICVMPLNTCNYAQTFWVCFGAVIALIFSLFCLSALLHCIFFSTFFSNFALSMTALMLIRTVLQSAHLSDATEYRQPCTILMSFFRSCKRTSKFLFFLSLRWNFF